MTPLQILIAARAKIEDPSRWTQGASARDVVGRSVLANSPFAVCWCASGAVYSLAKGDLFRLVLDILDMAASQLHYFTTYYLNDCADHATVLQMFDRAIELAGAV